MLQSNYNSYYDSQYAVVIGKRLNYLVVLEVNYELEKVRIMQGRMEKMVAWKIRSRNQHPDYAMECFFPHGGVPLLF